MKMKLRDLMLLFQWFPMRWIAVSLPRAAIILCGKLAGTILFHVKRGKRTLAEEELLKTCPDDVSRPTLNRIIRGGFIESNIGSMETFCFPKISPANINRWMRIHGDSHLRQALARGNGAVVVLAHFGANQMVMAALGHRGYPVNQIGSRPDDWHRLSGIQPTRIEQCVFRKRLAVEQALPAKFIYIDKSMRPVYQCLERNEIMLLAADGRAGTRFYQAPVTNRIMNVSAGPFRIAATTGAALIPAFPIRDSDGTHDLYIEEPICPPHTTTPADWAEQAAALYGQRLTEWVNFRPDHYVMLMTEARKRSAIDTVPLFEDYLHD